MTPESELLFYGEPSTEDDFLCDVHGCRLTSQGTWLICLECIADIEKEAQKDFDFWYSLMEKESEERDWIWTAETEAFT